MTGIDSRCQGRLLYFAAVRCWRSDGGGFKRVSNSLPATTVTCTLNSCVSPGVQDHPAYIPRTGWRVLVLRDDLFMVALGSISGPPSVLVRPTGAWIAT